MNVFFYTIFFILGTIVGSFLNVVILRYNTGVSFFSGRSFCPSCNKKLSWYELVPIVSFFVLRGKCAGCGSKISFQYPLIELTTGLLFLVTSYKLQVTGFDAHYLLSTIYYLLIWSLLIVISIYDLRHKIIPDFPVFIFSGLALVYLVVSAGFGNILHAPHSWDLLAGPLFALPFAALWYFSQGRWMGLGDAKLALGIGWFLGLIKGGSAIILGFWMGAIVGLMLVVLSKLSFAKRFRSKFGMKSEIPFGPFLILGTILIFFFNINLFDLGFVLF
ncbi:MAG: prepilin peptidase [bacterium]|nr:prepilin peptidase [bacterium]